MTNRCEFTPYRIWTFEVWTFFFAKWQRLKNWFYEQKTDLFEAEFLSVPALIILVVAAIVLIAILTLAYRVILLSWFEFSSKWLASVLLGAATFIVYCSFSEKKAKKKP